MKKIFKNNWQIIVLETLVLFAFALFNKKFGDIMVDSYRELYIPQQILKGQILYKDILVVYPPLAYWINALILLIFKNTFAICFSGLFSSLGVMYLTYRIANVFINKLYSFGICLFVISSLILSPNVFNLIFPYSYGMTYGLLFVLLSIYFVLNKKYPLSYLFYTLAILSKYEFVFLLPALVFYTGKKDWIKNVTYFFTPLFLVILIFFMQGISFVDINNTINIIINMAKTKTLHWFYMVSGLFFNIKLIPLYFINFIKFIFPIYWVKYQEILLWSLPVILGGLICKFKILTKNQKFFIIATLLISIKVFFAVAIETYGVYFLPFILISLFILISDKYKKFLVILLIIWSLIIGYFNSQKMIYKNNNLDNIINYVNKNTTVDDKVLVLPECLAINVKSNRDSDNKLYSLIPLYIETFGENLIIKRLEFIRPDYIILNDYDTSVYYFKKFGDDYANMIFKWIEKNYSLEASVKDSWEFKIYKKIF